MDKPDIYNKFNGHQVNDTIKFFEIYGQLLKNYFGNEKISLIDIGSGCGRVLKEAILSKSGLNFSEVIGIDISHEMIKFASKKYGNDLINFQFMDIQGEVPENLRTQKFDLVTSIYGLHFITRLDKAIENINYLLKPNGLFCCIFLQWYDVIATYDILMRKYPRYITDWRINFSSLWQEENPKGKLREHFEKAGIKIIEYLDVIREHNFENMENIMEFFKSIEILSKSMPDDVKRDFFQNFQKIFLSLRKNDDFVMSVRLLFVIAKRK